MVVSMPAFSVCLRDSQRPCVGHTTRTIPRRKVFRPARPAGHTTSKPVSNTTSNQEFCPNVNSVWQQATHTAAYVSKHPAGLFALGALVALLALSIFKRVWAALGLDRGTMHSNGGGRAALRKLIRSIFPPKDQQDAPGDTVWPGPLPSSYRASQAAEQGNLLGEHEASNHSSGGGDGKIAEAERIKLSEMSGVVRQASQKVAALEDLVSALKSQVKIAERRAGDAEAEAASLGNKMSIRDANAAKLKELAMQLSAAEAHIAEKTQALASANNEIRSLQQVGQRMLADERLSAERLEQETLTQHNDIGGLRQGLDAMRQQLVSNEAAIADAQAREQVLLQELDSSRQAKRSVEATLLQAAEDNVQLEAALSEAEANAAASQSSAEDIRGLLVAAEAQRDSFASQVETLQREVSAGAASVQVRDARIADMQRQLQVAQEHLQERQQALDRMEASVSNSSALGEQVLRLQSGMSQLEEAREAALQEAAAATAELQKVQQEVAQAIAAIAEQGTAKDGSRGNGEAQQGRGADTAALLPPSVRALPNSELQARARKQEAHLQQLQQQASDIEAELPVQSQRELVLLRSQLETLESQAVGPTDTPATELQAAQRDVRAAAEALLRDMLSTQQFRAHEEVVREIEGCGRMVAALRSACMRTLEERLREVLSQQWERERREMLADVATAEAASVSRAQAQLVEAEASAEAQRRELETWKHQQEAAFTAQAEESRQEAQAQQQEVARQQAALEQEQSELQAQAADLRAQAAEQAQLQEELLALREQYGDAEATASQAAELQLLEQQLTAQQAEVDAAEAAARAAAAEAAAEAARAADVRTQAEAAQKAVEARHQELAEREAAVDGEQQRMADQLGGVNQQLDDARSLADREIRQVRDAAAAETAAVKQQLQRVQAAQAAEGEAAQAGLREKVAALERELFTLKDRYSRQFIDYKLKLDVSEDRIRRLRRELAERGPGEPAPPPPPVPAVGPGEGEPPGAGGADALQGGASSVEDVSTWASQLVTKLSEESGSGRAAVAGTATADPAASAGAEQPPVWPSGESLAAAAAAVAPPAPATEADVLRLQACGHCIPHPAKLERGGEDAHFILGSYAIGVADGVGGWSKNGVDPGEYSRELMRQTAQALRRDSTRSMSCVDALTAAHDAVRMPGTCTAIVARMLDSTHLEVVNLGDSGLRIIRDGKIVFATESLQHGFNMPFQLGSKEFIPYTDVPASALRDVVEVEAGDVVFMASDGFFDNVWDSELARLVKNSCLFDGYEKENCVEHMAESLAQAAAGNSKDTTLRTPWSVACAKNKDVGLLKKLFPQGGKVDDISVIVAQIEAPGDS